MEPSHYSVYELVGGEATIRELVDRFYARVEVDPALRPMFPPDLTEGKRWQFLFLCQFFGGPQMYLEERGHPRLRMRHNPFPIGRAERDAWLGHMLAAVDETGIEEPMRTVMRDYFVRTSEHMINQSEE
ncbi:MAG: globin [Anaerolineae bacterium]